MLVKRTTVALDCVTIKNNYFFLVFKLLQQTLKLFLLLNCFSLSCLILFFVSHGNHSQDEIDKVERTQKDNCHKEQHVCPSSCPQDLWEKQRKKLQELRTNFSL